MSVATSLQGHRLAAPRRAGRPRRPGPGDGGARRDRSRVRQDRRRRARPTSSRRSSPTASSTGCRRSTRACATSTSRVIVTRRDALATRDEPARPAPQARPPRPQPGPAGPRGRAHRRPPDRAPASPDRRPGHNGGMSDIPPRLEPLLAPGFAGAEGRGRAHRRRATSATSSADRCATRSSAASAATARTSTSRPTPGPRRSRRCCGRSADGVVLVGRALRDGQRDRRRRPVRGHDVPLRRVPPREPQARGRVRRRHRDRPLAPRLLRERDGAAPARSPMLVDPFDGAIDLAERRLRTPHRARRLVHRRPAADAARGALHRRLRARAGARAGRGGRASTATGSRSSSAERIRDELSKLLVVDDPGPGLWFLAAHRALRRVPARAQRDAARAGPDPPPQGRARAHDRGRAEGEPRPRAAARRAAARRRQAQDRARSSRAARRSTTTRSSARGWPGSGFAVRSALETARPWAVRSWQCSPHRPEGRPAPAPPTGRRAATEGTIAFP